MTAAQLDRRRRPRLTEAEARVRDAEIVERYVDQVRADALARLAEKRGQR